MPTHESFLAFVNAAELGSFSAAARHMKKAQSAVSTTIANLEIDIGLELFDRSTRSPTLSKAGQSLLPYAKGILQGGQEFVAKATSMAEGVEDQVCLAVEQGIHLPPVLDILAKFSEVYPTVSLDILTTGPNDTADLLKNGQADLGLMTERESYPTGFQFRGVGYSVLATVCAPSHPLAQSGRVSHADLRQFRQIVLSSRLDDAHGYLGEVKSADVWRAESAQVIVELVLRGLGWAELPLPTVAGSIQTGKLARVRYAFQQSDAYEGIDVVWTEQHALGPAGQWLQDQFFAVSQDKWRGL